ncbi:hypothetical protein FQN54_004857 [Arachnomyces sp. PD_36]|nr:hypothetical protein FQN54_004857 [Arachnomyces sp. PD_36]
MPPSHPHLLTPYLHLPQYSLTVLTSVLGATSNWLVLRYLHAALSSSFKDADSGGIGEVAGRKRKVVLVSFLRGWAFWRAETRRLGLDLNRLVNENRLSFVDGVSGLFPIEEQSRGLQSSARPSAANAPCLAPKANHVKLQWKANEGLNKIEKDIVAAIDQLKTQAADGDDEILLIVDQPDLLLSATGMKDGTGATQMEDLILGLRSHVHSSIVTLSADFPLVQTTSLGEPHPQTPLEQAHSSFLIWMAHQATLVLQLRNLDTGVAKDVSGVLRISRGGSAGDALLGNGEQEQKWEENEYLYFVQGDGGVRVFGRGE